MDCIILGRLIIAPIVQRTYIEDEGAAHLRRIKFSNREYALLYELARNLGKVVQDEHLFKKIWPKSKTVTKQDLLVLIELLRKRLHTARGLERLHLERHRATGCRLIEISLQHVDNAA